MKKLALFAALFSFVFSTEALASETSGSGESSVESQGATEARPPHKKVKVQRRRAADSYRPVRPAPYRSRVIVHRPVVVSDPVVYHATPRNRVTKKQSSDEGGIAIGFRASGISTEGSKLNLASSENSTLGGVGFHVRGALDRHWAMEVAIDFLYSSTTLLDQTTVPLMISGIYSFVPKGPVRPYGLVGAGIHMTALEYYNGFRYDMVELAAQAGVGIDFRLSREFGIQLDLRFLGVYKNLDDEGDIYANCLLDLGAQNPFCASVSTEDKFNVGTQFMVGANWYF